MNNDLSVRFGKVLNELFVLQNDQNIDSNSLLTDAWNQTIQQAYGKTNDERNEYFIAALEFFILYHASKKP